MDLQDPGLVYPPRVLFQKLQDLLIRTEKQKTRSEIMHVQVSCLYSSTALHNMI
jgi:hypothetical protein